MVDVPISSRLNDVSTLPQFDLTGQAPGSVIHIQTSDSLFVARLIKRQDDADGIWLAEFHRGVQRTAHGPNLFGIRGTTRSFRRMRLGLDVGGTVVELAEVKGFPNRLIQGLRLELTLPELHRALSDGRVAHPVLHLGKVRDVRVEGRSVLQRED
jgi:hypothetical protein